MLNTEKSLDQIVALCKGRGFVYPGSEIYGGLAKFTKIPCAVSGRR